MMSSAPVLHVRDLTIRNGRGDAILDSLSITLHAGEVTAIVGETGSGKTTLLNSILGLLPSGLAVASGEIRLSESDDADLLALDPSARRRHLGTAITYVPQDVRSGLNPLMSARATVLEAARRVPGPARARADAALRRAGLSEDFVRRAADRRPVSLSGGQCQRVLIAQAIVNQPRVMLLDEPTAALDPTTKGDVLTTIRGLACDPCAVCLVTHDIANLAGIVDRVAVMYLGRIVESGAAQNVLERPLHPYTAGLLGCVPRIDRRAAMTPIPGDLPGPEPIAGCRFHPRCIAREPICSTEAPSLVAITPAREVACHVVHPRG